MTKNKRYAYQEMKDLGLADNEIHICRLMNLDPQVFIETKQHLQDPRNIDPGTGMVRWGGYRSMPLTSIREAKEMALKVQEEYQEIDTRDLELL